VTPVFKRCITPCDHQETGIHVKKQGTVNEERKENINEEKSKPKIKRGKEGKKRGRRKQKE
jgi:hypothetical protein